MGTEVSRALRRRFDRAAPGYEARAALDAEVASRMLERLELVRLDPVRVLDAGAGSGRDLRALKARYPRAQVVALDASSAMLREARAPRGLLERLAGRAPLAACGDLARLPFAPASFELAWSNLALPWVDEPVAALRELARVTRPEGLLMFSTFGPDTLAELAAAGGGVRRFADMHDLGDALVSAGFVNPVMDAERLTLSYADAHACLADLRATALSAGARQGPKGLEGRRRVRGIAQALDARRGNARLELGFELVYGHAWRGVPRRTADGLSIVRMPGGKRVRGDAA